MKKAALFDLDGVIVDTEGIYTEFWAAIGREYGLAPTFAYDIKGTTLTDILENHFVGDDVRSEVTRKIHDFEDTMKYVVFDGVIDFITSLRQAGYKTAIVTSSDDTKMDYLKRQQSDLLNMFDVIITGSMVQKSKPDPEGYLLAAKKVGEEIIDCYVFEDSIQGVEAGKRSGATVIGVATTNPAEKLMPFANEIIKDFKSDEIYEIIGFEPPLS
ncbi:MAG: HAD family phosphatase [Muribaculaceae bacterium]|nr:HAD family phosphatase [Muribaculaceae bacterium]